MKILDSRGLSYILLSGRSDDARDSHFDILVSDSASLDRTRKWPDHPLIAWIENPEKGHLKRLIDYDIQDIWYADRIDEDRVSLTLKRIQSSFFSQEENKRFQQIIEFSPSSVFITDLQGTIVYANQQFLEATGYKRDEVIGANPSLFKSGKHGKDYYQKMWQTVLAGKIWEDEICNRSKSGQLYWERVKILPIRGRGGEITHFVSLRIDDTDRRRADLLENIQQLAAGIAHEFSQPLQVLHINLSLLENQLAENKIFQRSQKMLDRVVELVTNLRKLTAIKKMNYLDAEIYDLKNINGLIAETEKTKMIASGDD